MNLDLIPNYEDIFEDLKNQPYNTVDGVPYGIPHGRGANVLMWRTDDVKPAPDSWSVVCRSELPVQGEGHDRTTTPSTSPMRPCT